MNAITRKRYRKLFNPKTFLNAMIRHGEMYREEVQSLPYHVMVFQECHNAVTWMARKLRASNLKDTYKFYVVTGVYQTNYTFLGGPSRREHSWLEYHDGDQILIFDLTLQQFKQDAPKLYIGPRTKNYDPWEITNIFDDHLVEHLLAVGY